MSPLFPERPLRVLMAYRADVDFEGGAAGVLKSTAAALRELGAEVEITTDVAPCVDGFDVVHPFNIWDPRGALDQLRHLATTGAPVAWQPFHLGWTEFAWAQRVMTALAEPGRAREERAGILEAMRTGNVAAGEMTRWTPNEPVAGLHPTIAEMASLVDHICVCSVREMQMLAQVAGLVDAPFTVTRHGVDAAAFAGADPAAFRALVDLDDFVLCVGTIETRKNQAMLAHALAGSGRGLVLVGPCFDAGALRLIEQVGDERVRRFDRLPRELVASAMRAAAVHALPSYAEGSALASMEAAAAGCPVVVSNRSSEFEYYGDLAVYCDPVDPGSIRTAVDRAAALREEDPERLEALRAHISAYTWEATARATLHAYRRAAGAARRRARAATALDGVRDTAVLAFADELCADPSLLTAYGARVGAGDDATLVIVFDDEHALGAAVERAGLDGPGSPDLLAVRAGAHALSTLGRAADGALTRRPLPAAVSHLPVSAFDTPLAAAA